MSFLRTRPKITSHFRILIFKPSLVDLQSQSIRNSSLLLKLCSIRSTKSDSNLKRENANLFLGESLTQPNIQTSLHQCEKRLFLGTLDLLNGVLPTSIALPASIAAEMAEAPFRGDHYHKIRIADTCDKFLTFDDFCGF